MKHNIVTIAEVLKEASHQKGIEEINDTSPKLLSTPTSVLLSSSLLREFHWQEQLSGTLLILRLLWNNLWRALLLRPFPTAKNW